MVRAFLYYKSRKKGIDPAIFAGLIFLFFNGKRIHMISDQKSYLGFY